MPHTLLLADDSVTIQRVIELTFADEDIRVVAVGDGAQAIRQAQSEPPDIVLADVGMPEMDGYQVAEFIKQTPALSHIPVLLLTGAFEPIDEDRARSAGCDGVLVKPFEPQMVITRVKDLISGKRPDISPRKAATPVAAPAAAPPAASTEDYLERLDAAFASRDAAAPRAPVEEHAPDPPTTVDLSSELAQWSPPSPANVPDEPRAIETLGDVSALFESESASPRHVPDVAAPVAAPVQMSAPAVNLADAFEALLAAEEGKPLESRAVQAIASSDAFVEQVTRLVIERLGDRAMRDVVLDVAERLVREEIERIKSQTR